MDSVPVLLLLNDMPGVNNTFGGVECCIRVRLQLILPLESERLKNPMFGVETYLLLPGAVWTARICHRFVNGL